MVTPDETSVTRAHVPTVGNCVHLSPSVEDTLVVDRLVVGYPMTAA